MARTPITRRSFHHWLLGSALAAAGTTPAVAQGTPARILVGFPAGGSFDALAQIGRAHV